MRASFFAFVGALAAASAASNAVTHDVTVGLIMERTLPPGSPVVERGTVPPQRMEVVMERDADGQLKLPRSWEEAKALVKRGTHMAKRHIKHKAKKIRGSSDYGSIFSTIITWYSGQDLYNPSCVSSSNWHPTDNSYVTALTENGWDNAPKCGDFIKITSDSGKSVVVRHVDSCAGCASGSKHCDLTKAAFLDLMDLDVGQASGLKAESVPSPVTNSPWSDEDVAKYGPEQL